MKRTGHDASASQHDGYHIQPGRAVHHYRQGPEEGQQPHRQPDDIDDRERVPRLENSAETGRQYDGGHGKGHDPYRVDRFLAVGDGLDESEPPRAKRRHQDARHHAKDRDHRHRGRDQRTDPMAFLARQHHRQLLGQGTAQPQIEQAQVTDNGPDQRQQPEPGIAQLFDQHGNAEYRHDERQPEAHQVIEGMSD
ncbi:hypothetical protein D3C71_1489000 [compost metagenome]